jgi:pilus assembly protein CpaB
MNRNRLLIGLGTALVLALIMASFVYQKFKQASNGVPTVVMSKIVVAAENIPLGTRLDASKLRTIPWPAGAPVNGMFTNISDVSNRAVITNVAENEPILDKKLAPVEAGGGMAATIPEGMRAVSVAVNEVVGVAGFVIPGTMVDVLVTGVQTGPTGGSITRTILEDVRVLAAGQKTEVDREGKPQQVPVITLLVTPDNANKLIMASNAGKIQLSLRNTVDVKPANSTPALQTNLFAFNTPQAPVAPVHHVEAPKVTPPPPYAVEIITGGKRESKNFPNQ